MNHARSSARPSSVCGAVLGSRPAPRTATPATRRWMMVWRPRERKTLENGQTQADLNLQLPPQPTERSEDGIRNLRARKYGMKALPLPAFMDAALYKRQNDWRGRKRSHPTVRPEELTAFQKEIRSNPHAAALATPVRQCTITSARLPMHFFIQFAAKYLPNPPEEDGAPAPPTAVLGYLSSTEDRSVVKNIVHVTARQSMVAFLYERSRWAVLINERLKETYQKIMERKIRRKAQQVFSWNQAALRDALDDLQRVVLFRMRALLETAKNADDATGSAIDKSSADTDAVPKGDLHAGAANGDVVSEASVSVPAGELSTATESFNDARPKSLLVPLDEQASPVDGSALPLNGIILSPTVGDDSAFVAAANASGVQVFALSTLISEEILAAETLPAGVSAWGIVKDPGTVPLLMALHKLEDFTYNWDQRSLPANYAALAGRAPDRDHEGGRRR